MSLADGLRGEDQRLLSVLTVAIGFAVGNVAIGDVAVCLLLLLQSILLLLMLLLLQLEYRHCFLLQAEWREVYGNVCFGESGNRVNGIHARKVGNVWERSQLGDSKRVA